MVSSQQPNLPENPLPDKGLGSQPLQELHSPRVPIVQTHRGTAELDIVEEAFAVTPSGETDAASDQGSRGERRSPHAAG